MGTPITVRNLEEMSAGCPDDGVSSTPAYALGHEWAELCAIYLPVIRKDSIWRYSCEAAPGDPEQGWKLHISATVLTANEVLKKVAPLLRAYGARFKAPASLRELQKLNCGLFYGYSQIGKFITVYPRTVAEATRLARLLDEQTCRMPAPAVPFDLRLRPNSSVYYRYGSFKRVEIEYPDGTRTPAIREPAGGLIPDLRAAETAKPAWVSDPFIDEYQACAAAPSVSPLVTTYRVFQALTQRGKGGVYKAFDLSGCPPRLCILKEGRAGGELTWDGRDGYWRIGHEERVLAALRAAGVEVPRVYSSFEVEGNYYLVTEFIAGETLQSLLHRRRRRLPLSRAILYGARLASLIARMHSAGWAWHDCKPANVIVTNGGMLRPLDFEGACLAERPDPARWSTPGFVPLAQPDACTGSGLRDDLYALGAVVYLLLTGKLPASLGPTPLEKLRRNVPARVCEIVAKLLSADPQQQCKASTVATGLTAVLSAFGDTPQTSPLGAGYKVVLARRGGRREIESACEISEPCV